jgi:ribosomal protein L40E
MLSQTTFEVDATLKNIMENLICPHCHTKVPRGAKVCTGCQAEVEYGTPLWALIFVLLIATIIGLFTRNSIFGGWVIFTVILIGGGVGCFKLFAKRINFKRFYRN